MSELVYNDVNKTDYSSDIQKLKSIKTLSIVSIVLILLFIVWIILPFVFPLLFIVWFLFIIPSAFIIAACIISLIIGIQILTINWKHQDVEAQKIIWGVFTLVLLGPISSLIFSVGGLNKMK